MRTITRDDWRILEAVLPRDGLVTNPVDLLTYEADGSLGLGSPQGVALPRSADEVVEIVRWAAQHDLPVIARGAGTGLSGGAVAVEGGITVSFARMKQVVEMDEVGR